MESAQNAARYSSLSPPLPLFLSLSLSLFPSLSAPALVSHSTLLTSLCTGFDFSSHKNKSSKLRLAIFKEFKANSPLKVPTAARHLTLIHNKMSLTVNPCACRRPWVKGFWLRRDGELTMKSLPLPRVVSLPLSCSLSFSLSLFLLSTVRSKFSLF